ncbi:MAG TPA: hypothetical protein VHS06_01995 [Chloroflexota bacterium]|nr:hypothetical protein [Chloroflexota bacterium]
MNIMRYTVIDDRGTVSFVADCDALLPMVAGCARDPKSVEELLAIVDEYDSGIEEKVTCSLAIFDEMNTADNHESIHKALDFCRPHELPAFRVLDDRTREASLTPVHAGVVVFNLPARRIVQIQNSYEEIQRRARRKAAKPATPERGVVKYELPDYWSLVPEI